MKWQGETLEYIPDLLGKYIQQSIPMPVDKILEQKCPKDYKKQ